MKRADIHAARQRLLSAMAPHSEPVLLPIKLISVSFRDYRKRIILTMRAANDLIDCCTIDRVRQESASASGEHRHGSRRPTTAHVYYCSN